MRRALGLALAFSVAASSLALAMPSPVKSVPGTYYSGRWYEIARTTSKSEHNCDGVTYDFTGQGDSFDLALTCRKGDPAGPKEVTRSTGRTIAGSNGARFKLTFMAVIPVEYWVLDLAPDASWFILARDNGKYVWIMSRKPQMDAAQKTLLVNRIKALGLETGNLEYPDQPPAA